MLQVRHTVLSEPAEVWWAGFRSDTYRLQQQGWEIAAHEDVMYDRIRLLLRHRDMRLHALTNEVSYQFREMHETRRRPLEFHVVMAAPKFQIQNIGPVDFAAFRQIDAQPQFAEIQVKSLDDFKIFATPLARTEEIIVEPQTVAAMLERIREMQAPEQARLRAKQRQEASRSGLAVGDAVPRQKFHAQIISLEEHRLAA